MYERHEGPSGLASARVARGFTYSISRLGFFQTGTRALHHPKADVSVQVTDFSPVIPVFRVFHPISQLQEIDFSPVTQKARDK